MIPFADIHSHFVYGIDDGAQTRQEMEFLLDMAYQQGIRCLFATPHMMPGLRPFDQRRFYLHLQEAQQYCRARQYALALHSGAEILYTPMMKQYLMQKRLPTMGQTKKILMEFMPDVHYSEIMSALQLVNDADYTVILAHIERYPCLRKKQRAMKIKEKYPSVLFQVNAGSFINQRGWLTRRCMDQWLKQQCIDFIASDAHHCQKRPFYNKRVYDLLFQKYEPAYIQSLFSPQSF